MSPFALYPLANILLATLLSAVVLWRNPKSIITKAFGLGAGCVMVMELGHSLSMISSRGSSVLFWYKFALAGACFLPVSWSLFSFILLQRDPKTIAKRRQVYLLFLLTVGICFLVLLPSGSLVYLLPEAQHPLLGAIRFGPAGRWFLIGLLLSVVVMLIVLENTYRNARRKEGRHTLFGLIGGLLYAIFLLSQGLMYSRIPSAALLLGSIVVSAVGLLMAYDIIRYRLLEVEIYVGREAVYSSAILLLVGAYLILMGLVGKLVRLIGGNLGLFFTILAAFVMFSLLLALLVSGSLKKRLKAFVDKNFYRGRYDYREQWLRFSEETSFLLSLEEILPQFLQMTVETLDVRSGCVLLPDAAQGDFILAEAHRLGPQELRILGDSEFLEWLFILSQPIALDDNLFDDNPAQEVSSQRDHFRHLGLAVLVPLITNRKLVGLLALGPKNSEDSFSSVDLELLEAIGNHLSVAILNAKLSEELVLSKELEFIHKISSFVVHDLKNLVSTLSMLLQNATANMDKREFRESMIVTIAGTVEKMKALMGKISTVPKDLQLDFQPQDLNSIVREVVSKVKVNQIASIEYVEDLKPLPLTSVNREYVERILLNLIVNAMEAMHREGTLRISSRLAGNGSLAAADHRAVDQNPRFVEIEVADTGPGMSAEFIKYKLFRPFQTSKRKGLGIGLYQCKEAVEAHNGRIEVRSEEGQGTVFLIRLPVNQSVRHH
jgi:putative PEP-CTERM system histidine kinase